MIHEILVFKGICGSYVFKRDYDGRLPPHLEVIEIENEQYQLTIFPVGEKKYLVAHNDSLLSDVATHAIEHHNLKPLQQ